MKFCRARLQDLLQLVCVCCISCLGNDNGSGVILGKDRDDGEAQMVTVDDDTACCVRHIG